MSKTPTNGPTWESKVTSPPGEVHENGHIPVLYQSVLENLAIKPGGRFLDGTVGGGGHASGILSASSPDGCLLGLDRDPEALRIAGKRLSSFGERATLVHASFDQMGDLAPSLGFAPLDGVLLDLGLSSMQLEDPERGFAIKRDGPLDMRFDPGEGQTAADLVNHLSQRDLEEILFSFGEEPDSRKIARAIVSKRPFGTTAELASVVSRVKRGRRQGLRIHPATRTFQALRIAVNRELNALSSALPQAVRLLKPGGRLVVIAFHSLEDRIVKRFLQSEVKDCLCPPEIAVCVCDHEATLNILTPKPIRPRADEIERNPRSRSARLRAAVRI